MRKKSLFLIGFLAVLFTSGNVFAGDKYYTVYQILSKDYATIQRETNNGRDRIIITGLFPSKDEIKAGLLERDWCVTLPEVELKKLKFGGGSICINIDQQTLTGEASCEPAFLGGGSIAGSFTAGRNGLRADPALGHPQEAAADADRVQQPGHQRPAQNTARQ